jgi:hypothetical protein
MCRFACSSTDQLSKVCEKVNKYLWSIKGANFLDIVSNYQLFKRVYDTKSCFYAEVMLSNN